VRDCSGSIRRRTGLGIGQFEIQIGYEVQESSEGGEQEESTDQRAAVEEALREKSHRGRHFVN
jgi:hypothetical protein